MTIQGKNMSTTRLPWGLSKNKAALLLLAIAIIIFVVLRATRPTAQVDPSAEPVYSVRTLSAQPAALSPMLKLYGTVVAPGRAELTAALSADVVAVHKLAGDTAARGELLIELDDAEAQIALTQASAGLQQAEAQLALDRSQRSTNKQALEQERELLALAERAVARAVKLRNDGVLSEADLDATKQNLQRQKLALQQRELAVRQADAVTRQLQAQLRSAEARLQAAELDLARTRIHAPFEAAVLATRVAVGDRVNPGQALIELYDTRRVEIRAQVPSRYLAGLRRAREENLPVTAVATSAGRRLPATFTRLASSGGGGGQDAYFRLLGADLPVDSKLSLELVLPPEEDAIALPFDAIYDLSRIFRVRDGRLQSLSIEKLGDYVPQNAPTQSQYLLVRASGVEAGDEIVISQLPNAITGLKVQTITQ